LGNTVKVRNVVIGEGLPKICVPITGRCEEDILAETRAVLDVPADIAEWRADWYEKACEGDERTCGLNGTSEIAGILGKIREILGDMPLLMTFRTAREGGEQEADADTYQKICIDAIRSGYIDLIDVELSCGEKTAGRIIEEAGAAGVRVVASSHDFDRTPDKSEMTGRLFRMKDLRADILKLAVMPQSRSDVAALLEVAADAAERTGKPVIAISMGQLGVISRVACEAFGSSATFAAASRASAPGQIGAAELKEIHIRLHEIK
jgi:3-dehydroquinate dehydratase-1